MFPCHVYRIWQSFSAIVSSNVSQTRKQCFFVMFTECGQSFLAIFSSNVSQTRKQCFFVMFTECGQSFLAIFSSNVSQTGKQCVFVSCHKCGQTFSGKQCFLVMFTDCACMGELSQPCFSMDHSPIRQTFEFGKLMQNIVKCAKYRKMCKIQSCEVCEFCILLYYARKSVVFSTFYDIFSTKLHNFTKFMMLFPAVLMNFPNSTVCLIEEWSIRTRKLRNIF